MNLNERKILVVFNPWREYKGSLLEMLVDGLETNGLQVEYLDILNPPKYEYNSISDIFRNIYNRTIKKNKQYILKLENDFVNAFYLKKIKKYKRINDTYFDYVLIIKPEEFSPNIVKEIVKLGNQSVGYTWDGLRIFLKDNLLKNRKYLNEIYSFDTNNIIDHPELKFKFCTNFAYYNQLKIPYNKRKLDLFFIGDLAGIAENQRRDLKLDKFLQNINGSIDINIFLGHAENRIQKINSKKVKYINSFISLRESKLITSNTKIVIDVCKAHHIGLSFRFFECLATETKIITNNQDVINYDFYHPNNIMIVDFENEILDQEIYFNFLNLPYEKIEQHILDKYSIENWVKYLFKIDDYIPITKK